MTRWARRALAGVVAAALVAGGSAARASDPYGEVALALGQGLVLLFPPAEGLVVSADAGEVYIDLAEKDLMRTGMELQAYRPGAEMVHPVTRQALGTYETHLGYLHVTEVRERYSRAMLDAAGPGGLVPGDRVRVSSRRLRALLSVGGAAPGVEVGPLAQALLARGAESGRFTMIDEPAWAPALAALGVSLETAVADPAALRRLGEKAPADLLLLARISPGERPVVTLGVRSLRTGAALGEVSGFWPAAPSAPVAAQPAAAADGEYTVRELPGAARALAVGNVLGEGRVEIVLSDGGSLSLHRWDAGGLTWRWDERGRGGRRILSLDAADLDGDGRAEVLVTAIVAGRVFSEVRSWRDGALGTVGRADGLYLRTARRPEGGVILLGQRAGIDEVLEGRVEEYRWRGDAVERVDGTALPRGVGIFGLALAPPGSAAAFYSLKGSGYLYALSSGGDALWRSARAYGGYPPPLAASDLGSPGTLGGADDQAFDEAVRVFQGRVLAQAIPGGVRLVVPRNNTDSPVVLARLRTIGKGELVVLEGPAASLEEARRSREFDGSVTDFALADADGDGAIEVLFTVSRYAGPLLGERGKLVLWRLGGLRGGEK